MIIIKLDRLRRVHTGIAGTCSGWGTVVVSVRIRDGSIRSMTRLRPPRGSSTPSWPSIHRIHTHGRIVFGSCTRFVTTCARTHTPCRWKVLENSEDWGQHRRSRGTSDSRRFAGIPPRFDARASLRSSSRRLTRTRTFMIPMGCGCRLRRRTPTTTDSDPGRGRGSSYPLDGIVGSAEKLHAHPGFGNGDKGNWKSFDSLNPTGSKKNPVRSVQGGGRLPLSRLGK